MEDFKQKIDDLNKECHEIELLKTVEEKTKVKAIYIVLAGLVCLIGLMLAGYFDQFLANMCGCAYPLYKSIKSLESPSVNDDKQWLTYWTVYGLFMILDDYSDFITDYIPYFFLLKLMFFIWLFAPTTRGAMLLYNTIIKIFLIIVLDQTQVG